MKTMALNNRTARIDRMIRMIDPSYQKLMGRTTIHRGPALHPLAARSHKWLHGLTVVTTALTGLLGVGLLAGLLSAFTHSGATAKHVQSLQAGQGAFAMGVDASLPSAAEKLGLQAAAVEPSAPTF